MTYAHDTYHVHVICHTSTYRYVTRKMAGRAQTMCANICNGLTGIFIKI